MVSMPTAMWSMHSAAISVGVKWSTLFCSLWRRVCGPGLGLKQVLNTYSLESGAGRARVALRKRFTRVEQ